MKRLLPVLLLLFGTLISPTTAQDDTPTPRPLLLAHYMPWYQSPEIYGSYGWHWTMQHFNPYQKDEAGRREIASHYMPLTDAYDSSDPDLLEYQVLLMKLSGIDGVIVDWYGIEDGFRDYAMINESTLRLFEAIGRAGLFFVLCYEDQTVLHMTDEGHLPDFDAAIAQGAEDMQFAQAHFFSDPAYLTRSGQPFLFVFGPQYFRSPDNWTAMFEGLPAAPLIVTLDNRMSFGAFSSYPWPPMSFAGGATLAPAVLDSYLDQFYRNARRSQMVVGSAFPAFDDIYEQAGVRSSYGTLDPADGETFRRTLDKAIQANAEIIQLVTWNDYGEGTMIEPTEEFGYDRLEIVQETRKSFDAAFVAMPESLTLPLRLFRLRKAHKGDAEVGARLDGVFDALLAGDFAAAEAALVALEG